MARLIYFKRIRRSLEERLRVAATRAANRLLENLKTAVGIPCPAFHEKLSHKKAEANHSPIGGPPFKETGEGQNSIVLYTSAPKMITIGLKHINDRIGNQLGFWDSNTKAQRPWFKSWWEGKWKPLFEKNVREAFQKRRYTRP